MKAAKPILIASSSAILLLITLVCATDKDTVSTLNASGRRIETVNSNPNIYSPKIPDRLDFCGESVPLDLYYVREALDRELIVNTFSHTSTLLYFKRAHRYFPVIEPILKKNGIPDDFKYLCVIESGLTNATSPAKAQGFWQFIKATGQKYGLEISDEIDMRNNLEASTHAACKFLKYLKQRLGSWTNAAAAYNCGENGLEKRLINQHQKNYYELLLNRETQRYVYRILAIKLIMQHPQDYGYYVRHCDTYPELPYEEVELNGKDVDIVQFAIEHGTTYKMLRTMNPWLTTDKLKNKSGKTYTVRIPTKKGTEYNTIVKGKHDTTIINRI